MEQEQDEKHKAFEAWAIKDDEIQETSLAFAYNYRRGRYIYAFVERMYQKWLVDLKMSTKSRN